MLLGLKFARELQSQVATLSSDLKLLEEELRLLRTQSGQEIGALSDDIVRIETNYTRKVSAMDEKLVQMDGTLTRLTNHTSNAEVLDRLKQTRVEIDGELTKTKSDVNVALDVTRRNISRTLKDNQAKMQQTELSLREVVHQAKSEINVVQNNVTQQLAGMSRTLQKTVEGVKESVDSAQVTIHNEVKIVQDNIEQYVAFTNKQFAAEDDFVKYQLAGTFTILGCIISGYHLTAHLRHYYKPEVQRRIMAVLWMVPIYGITSWLSLVFPKFESVFGALRDCYEAYAVYTFIALLIAILEDGRGLADLLTTLTQHVIEERRAVEEASRARTKRPAEHLRPPFPCCYEWHKPSQVAKAWLYQCRLMALQFVITKPFFSLAPFFSWMIGFDYEDHPPFVHQQINWASPKLYVTFCQNMSVAVAFYGLLSFYHGTEKDLAWCDPWPKFLCIKGVVFMTFWQGLVMQGMASIGFVADRQAMQIQNLLICIEMLLASLAHLYIFPYYEWEDGYKREKEKSVLLRDTLALRDFVTDMKMMVTRWEGGKGEGEEEEDGEEDDEAEEKRTEERPQKQGSAQRDGKNLSSPSPLALRAPLPSPSPSPSLSLSPRLTSLSPSSYYQATWSDSSGGEEAGPPGEALSAAFSLPPPPRPTGFGSASALLGRPETLIDADIDDLMSVAMESIGQAVSQLESGRGGVGVGVGSGVGSGQLIPGAGGTVTPGKKRKSKGGGGPKTDPKKPPTTTSEAASDFSLVGVELLELSGATTLPPASSASGASTGPPSAEADADADAEAEAEPGSGNGAGEDEESRLFLSEVPSEESLLWSSSGAEEV